jgi:hypothetical protein
MVHSIPPCIAKSPINKLLTPDTNNARIVYLKKRNKGSPCTFGKLKIFRLITEYY